jgi:hypothetical protein
MTPANIEEHVRQHIASERAQIVVPSQMALRILRAVEVSKPVRGRPGTGVLQLAAAMAFVLLLAAGIIWLRTAQSASRLVHGTWSPTGSMVDGRGFHTATRLADGRVLVVGGIQVFGTLASAELYDPRIRTWSKAGSLPTPRWGHTATLLKNGKVLVVGGSAADGVHLGSTSSAELYDPKTNTWYAAANMRTPRSFHTATLLPDGRVLVVGGLQAFTDVTGRVLASVEVYDPATDAWSPGPPLAAARAKHDAILLANHDVLVLGGTQSVGNLDKEASRSLRTAELFDPATDTWSTTASMQDARILPTAMLLPDDRVLVVGDEASNELTAEVFDYTSGRWSSIAAPGFPRADAVGFQLHNGTVLVAGGVGQTGVEEFDWHTDAWIKVGNLTEIRASATATALADGRILVAAGWGSLSVPWSSAELYDPNGTSAMAATSTRSVSPPIAISALLIAIATVLLGLGLSLSLRRRLAHHAQAGETWVD